MKYDKRNIKKWINALRSGEYKQTQDALQNEHGYCCLGVACKIFIPKNKLECNNGYLYGTVPIEQAYVPNWLAEITYKQYDGHSLTYLNDDMRLSFNEIADILQIEHLEGL